MRKAHLTASHEPPTAAHALASPTALPARRVLSWVYIGRVVLGTTLLLGLAGDSIPPSTLTLLLLITTAFTVGSYYLSHGEGRRPDRLFHYAQVIFDVLLVTSLVYLTGGESSIFAPLFILVITAGALLLPILGGILVGFLASSLFLGAAIAGSGTVDPGVRFQAIFFAIAALVTGYIGDRLRQTGAALGEVQTALRLLRLDTDDILDTIGTAIITVDGEGRLAYVNPAAIEMLGLSTAEWMDQPIIEKLNTIAPGLGEVIDRTARMRTPIRRFETEPLEDDSFVLGVSTTLLERSTDQRPSVTAIFQDITERKRAEEFRRRAERLEAVAELSASLAHEIKNPLASIRSAVEQIASGRTEPEDTSFLGGLIVRETERLSRLLGEFIDFARVKVTAPQPVDLAALVRGVIDVIRAHPDARENNTSLTLKAPDAPILIRGAEDVLHRAVFNLVLNAVQWSGRDGKVELTLDGLRSDLLSPALGAFRLVRLSVRDTGPGVPEEIRDQIFDPFFTRRSGGTGLGLALVQRAVEAHGGAVFVDGAGVGEPGAVFSLYLPTLVTEVAARTEPPIAQLKQL